MKILTVLRFVILIAIISVNGIKINAKHITPPQKINRLMDNKIIPKQLFNENIFSSNYLLKLDANIGNIKKLIKKQAVLKLSPSLIRSMLAYKFKLLKSKPKRWLNNYFIIFSTLANIDVLLIKHIDKVLILFFFNDTLYSIKMREEFVTFNDFFNVLNKVQIKFKGALNKTRYGYLFKYNFNNYLRLEYAYYEHDYSTETTLYNVNSVRLIEKIIKNKLYKND